VPPSQIGYLPNAGVSPPVGPPPAAVPSAHAHPERQSSGSLLAAAQSLTGIAALVLGLTYAIGASLRAGELRAAGVDVREGLAVVPIEQLLTRGIDALLDPRNVLLFAALLLLGVFAAASGWAMQRRVEGYEKRMYADLAEEQARMSLTADHEKRARRAELLEAERAWREEELAHIRRHMENAPGRVQASMAAFAAVVLVIIVLGFVPWVYGLSVAAGVGVLCVLAVLVWGSGTPPSAIAFFAGLLVVVASGIMVDGQANPRPPAQAALTLKAEATGEAKPFGRPNDGHAVFGRLVAVTDQGWYLSSTGARESDHKMLAISRDEVAAGVTSPVRKDVQSTVELAWDWLF
jgi:hypothetical protein